MKKLFYIDYPQEHLEGQAHTYRCVHCKEVTTKINGSLEGHLPTCEYRLKLENAGYDAEKLSEKITTSTCDDFD
jgi:hypothetical protein